MAQRGVALVTGASAGLGEAFARELAARGHDLVLVARREERLRALAEEVRARWGVTARVEAADLADPATPRRLHERLTADGVFVEVLVNDAGYGVPGRFLDRDWETHADFLQVLVVSLTELCHRFVPAMVARGRGRVINVASAAAFLPAPVGSTLYGPAKAFVAMMSESLALELEGTGVHVLASCPGLTHTEFHRVTGVHDQVNALPALLWMDAETVAREALDAVERGGPVRVHGAVNRAVIAGARLLPGPVRRAAVRRGAKAVGRE